jgi:glycyl-tRNA synthetase
MAENTEVTMDKLTALAKQRGFVFQGSEIYGGLANSWDFGPMGTELKNNIRDWWWNRFVHRRPEMVGMDTAILMSPKVWEASGHLENFHDIKIDCMQCKARHRADHLIENKMPEQKVEGLPPDKLTEIIEEKDIACPTCGSREWTDAREFNLLFKTGIGSTEESANEVFMRPEIAQSIFTNFRKVLKTSRKTLPFGIAAVGRSFRNEITPGNFLFRTIEFEQMEIEYFVREENWEEHFDHWLEEMQTWLGDMNFDPERVRVREHTDDELSHYSDRTADLEYDTPFGWQEMFGLAYRTDYDLKQHMEESGVDMRYTDRHTNEKFLPHVVEPSLGLSRLVLMAMLDAYEEEAVGDGDKTRTVMRFHPRLAPYKIAVLPLSKKKGLPDIAKDLQMKLTKRWYTDYDETQSIGKRYRRQDEVGTPYCITVDFDTLDDDQVTVRDRDSMEQDRVAIEDLEDYFEEKFDWE